MQVGWLRQSAKYFLGAGLLLAVLGRTAAWGDDTGLLGRIFRFGSSPASSNTAPPDGGQPAPPPYGGPAGNFPAARGFVRHGAGASLQFWRAARVARSFVTQRPGATHHAQVTRSAPLSRPRIRS